MLLLDKIFTTVSCTNFPSWRGVKKENSQDLNEEANFSPLSPYDLILQQAINEYRNKGAPARC